MNKVLRHTYWAIVFPIKSFVLPSCCCRRRRGLFRICIIVWEENVLPPCKFNILAKLLKQYLPKKCSLYSLTAQLLLKLNYQCERCFSRKIMQSSYLFQVFNEDFEYPLNDKGNLDFHFIRPSQLAQSAYHVKLRHQKRTKIQIQMFSNIHKA